MADADLDQRLSSGHTYYRLKAREEIDNPDQRITDDVKAYTQTTLFLLHPVAQLRHHVGGVPRSPLVDQAAVGLRCRRLRGGRHDGNAPPGWRLVHLNNLQLKKEADLRYDLIQVREAAETIATLGIEKAVRAASAAVG